MSVASQQHARKMQTLHERLNLRVTQRRDLSIEARVHSKLKKQFRELRDALETIAVHPTPLDLGTLLSGDIPKSARNEALKQGRPVVLRIKGSRALWFLSDHGSAARTAATTVDIDDRTWYLWNVDDTDEEMLCRLV